MENMEGLFLFLALYTAPLWISVLCIVLYRTLINKDGSSRDFFTGVIFAIGVREMIRWIRPKGRR